MYEPPIKLIMGELQTQFEENCMRAVQSYGFDVDKNELVKALEYDRNQYEKGYADGKTDAWWVINGLAHKYGFEDNQVKMVREMAQKMAAALLLLGAGGIDKPWLTATENYANVKSAYDKGYHDGRHDAVEVVHGHWIDAYPEIEPNPMFAYGICSVCGFEQSISDKLPYCPNCGAKMDEVNE